MVTSAPPRGWAGLAWFLDTNVIDDPDAEELRRLRDAGWISLQAADTLLVEVVDASDPDKRAELIARTEALPMAYGPLLLGHSMLGRTVLGSKADHSRIDAVYQALWERPGKKTKPLKESKSARRRTRDALHVATAIRYGASGFVTRDGPLLKRAAAVAARFDRFPILSVEAATERSHEAVLRVRREADLTGFPNPTSLPAWP